MRSAYANGHLGAHRPILENPSVQPAVDASSTTFVATYLLVSIAVVAAITLIAMAPLNVIVPLGVVFFAYLLGTLVLSIAERRRRPDDQEPGSGGTTAAARDPADGVPSGVIALAVLSVGLLVAAFAAPERLGAMLAALGLGGLFIYRIIAMPAGWSDRRAAGI